MWSETLWICWKILCEWLWSSRIQDVNTEHHGSLQDPCLYHKQWYECHLSHSLFTINHILYLRKNKCHFYHTQRQIFSWFKYVTSVCSLLLFRQEMSFVKTQISEEMSLWMKVNNETGLCLIREQCVSVERQIWVCKSGVKSWFKCLEAPVKHLKLQEENNISLMFQENKSLCQTFKQRWDDFYTMKQKTLTSQIVSIKHIFMYLNLKCILKYI